MRLSIAAQAPADSAQIQSRWKLIFSEAHFPRQNYTDVKSELLLNAFIYLKFVTSLQKLYCDHPRLLDQGTRSQDCLEAQGRQCMSTSLFFVFPFHVKLLFEGILRIKENWDFKILVLFFLQALPKPLIQSPRQDYLYPRKSRRDQGRLGY